MTKIDIGIIGLSVMGRSLALNMADHGFKVGGYNRSAAVTKQVVQEHPHENLVPFYDLEALISSLTPPRRVMLMIQAGKPVDAVIGQLAPLLEQGDIIMDGGNSFYGDTVRRARELEEKGIHYLGVGISGGEEGALNGASIMPGGSEKDMVGSEADSSEYCSKSTGWYTVLPMGRPCRFGTFCEDDSQWY